MSEKNKILKTIKEALGVNSNITIKEENTLDELGANLLDVNEVTMRIEELLDIDDIETLLGEEWTVMTTVGHILKFCKTV